MPDPKTRCRGCDHERSYHEDDGACGHTYVAHANDVPTGCVCSAFVEPPRKCPQCGAGTKARSTATMCWRCGASLTPSQPSQPAATETTTFDDGSFVRTALVLKSPECGSIDVVRMVDGKPVRLCQINLFDYLETESLIVDVIDVDNRYAKRRALVFNPGTDRPRTELDTAGDLVSADFRNE